jgi:hypothetical protein
MKTQQGMTASDRLSLMRHLSILGSMRRTRLGVRKLWMLFIFFFFFLVLHKRYPQSMRAVKQKEHVYVEGNISLDKI